MNEHHQNPYQPPHDMYGQTPQPPYDPYRVPQHRAGVNPRNGLGIAALVLAVVGTLFGFFPITFIPALACAFAALVLVILAWVMVGRRRRTSKAVTIVASAFTALSLTLGVWGGVTFISTLDQLGDDLDAIGGGTSATSAPATDDATDEPTAEPTDTGPSTVAMGETITLTQTDLGEDGETVDTEADVTVSGPRYGTNAIDEWSSGPANGYFVVFTVKVEGTQGKFTFSSGDFYVKAKNGDRYDQDDGNAWEATRKDQLEFQEFNAGERKKGPMAFDLPVKHGQLIYDPNYEGQPVAVWEF